ncbi:MAG: class I SAM-dependent methyltransferase, partial [Chitinophagia bacterium]|nr:class I SAM-dependent methyltransferase [Chitinophagia bacterium]
MILDKICEYYKNSTESWANLFDANRVECFRFFTDLSLHDKVISDALCFKSGENILDAGCGVGEPGVSFAKLFPDTNFYLVNISKYQLSKIDSTLDNVYLINSDFHSLNFSDEFFDKIYFLESFSHSLFKRKLIKEVYRVL